uniref:Neuromedin-B n=1 Tax=Electrophorus electricus TaxID=8005 RepID=A0A4W4FJX9_ELEEL
MAITSFGGNCKFGLMLTYLAMSSYIPISTSVSLDLNELRNKLSKIKANPRGNLWATGHFMGKKSFSDSQVVDSQPTYESKMKHLQAPTVAERSTDELEQVIAQNVLKAQLTDPRERQDSTNRVIKAA